jgi:hypothetical protein
MKMFNFRAKVKIVGAIFFVAILLSVAVLGGTRIISDSSDNIKTFITNSNGGVWDVTWDNVQAAVDDQDGNGTVWIPEGEYTPTSTLYINDTHVTLQGQGGAHWGITGATIINPSVELPNGIINVTGGTGFQIFDIKFKEGRYVRPSHTTHAIKVRSSHSITIDRCGFQSINGSAIYLDYTVYSASILNCDFQGCGGYYGVNTFGTIVLRGHSGAYVTDVVIDNCVFEAGYSYCIDEEIGERVSPVSITNCYFEPTDTQPLPVAVYGVFRYGEITGNYFQGIDQHAIGIHITTGISYCLINDNFFTLWDDAIYVQGGYVTVSNNRITSSGDESINGYNYCSIIDNTIKDSGGQSIIMGTGSIVSRNKIYNSGSDAIKIGGSNVLISENLIDNTNGTSGIKGFSKNNISIINNEINDVSSGIYVENLNGKIIGNTVQHATEYPIYCSSGSDNTLCHDNFISNCNGSMAIFVYGSHNVSIQGNQITKDGLSYGIRLGIADTRDCFIANNNFIGFTSNQITAYSGATLGNQTILNNPNYKYQSLFPFYNQSTPPTLSNGQTAYWYNNTGGWMYDVVKVNGTQFYLNMSTTY